MGAKAMPKAYIISRVEVKDPERYAQYIQAATDAIARYGGRPLARGGRTEVLEGNGRPRNVVIEFASMEQATAYYRSPEYQAAIPLRDTAAVVDIIAVEGIE